jgi:hypothetical protein
MLTGVLRFHLIAYSIMAVAEMTAIKASISGGENSGGVYAPVTVGVIPLPDGASTVYCGVA